MLYNIKMKLNFQFQKVSDSIVWRMIDHKRSFWGDMQVVGSKSLGKEVELVQLYITVLR
jgi:hypothetical protein